MPDGPHLTPSPSRAPPLHAPSLPPVGVELGVESEGNAGPWAQGTGGEAQARGGTARHSGEAGERAW